ncbi:hypothetical protein H9P43_006204 [Blastocladiella emersonii ATCC 22665]|nr:hypothetical protein H9P43_006204 [Blastocladiella emersonii ATCC 22665]
MYPTSSSRYTSAPGYGSGYDDYRRDPRPYSAGTGTSTGTGGYGDPFYSGGSGGGYGGSGGGGYGGSGGGGYGGRTDDYRRTQGYDDYERERQRAPGYHRASYEDYGGAPRAGLAGRATGAFDRALGRAEEIAGRTASRPEWTAAGRERMGRGDWEDQYARSTQHIGPPLGSGASGYDRGGYDRGYNGDRGYGDRGYGGGDRGYTRDDSGFGGGGRYGPSSYSGYGRGEPGYGYSGPSSYGYGSGADRGGSGYPSGAYYPDPRGGSGSGSGYRTGRHKHKSSGGGYPRRSGSSSSSSSGSRSPMQPALPPRGPRRTASWSH